MRRLFIVGVGRSGTSLVQSMLATHPRIAMLPETGFFRRYCITETSFPREAVGALPDHDPRLRRIPARCWERIVATVSPAPDGRVSSWDLYDALLGVESANCLGDSPGVPATVVADKDPRLIEYVPLLARRFPDAIVIHMVRDPRDVLLSKQKAAWSAGRSWIKNLAAGVFQLTLADRYVRELGPDRVVTVRYEDLISDPEKVLRSICERIGVEYDSGMLGFSAAAKTLSGGQIEPWKRETLGPLLSGNAGKWRTGLTRSQVAITETVMRPWFSKYRYSASKSQPVWSGLVGAIARGAAALYRWHRIRSIRAIRRNRALQQYRSDHRDTLRDTVQYVTDHPRSTEYPSAVSKEQRSLRSRFLVAASRLGFPGMWSYWLLLLLGRAARYGSVGSLVVSDHSSGVVRTALQRVFPHERIRVREVPVARSAVAVELVRAFFAFLSVYRHVRPMSGSQWFAATHSMYYVAAGRAFVSVRKPSAVLLSLTSDRKRIGLGYAAVEASVPTGIFFLDRYRVFRHLPFRPDVLFCFTSQQKTAYKHFAERIVVMPSPIFPIRPVPPQPRIGVLLNARCDVNAVHAFVEKLHVDFPHSTVSIRPHPGFDVQRLYESDQRFVTDWKVPLIEFLDQVDLSFAPNSNVVIDSLLHGIPVVYVYSIDPIFFDEHRYVADGLTVSYEDVGSSISEINAFFTGEQFISAWSRVGYSSDTGPEREALQTLTEGKR